MAVLKKIKASTLMETLMATVLIVVIFMIASLILNNLFSDTVKNSTNDIKVHLKELEYFYQNGKITLPYQEKYKKWQIQIEPYIEENRKIIELKAFNSITHKSLTEKINEIP